MEISGSSQELDMAERKKPRDYPRALFHIPERLLPEIASRSDRIDDPKAIRSGSAYGNTTRRDVVRYYSLLKDELMTLRLTQAEAIAVCEALHPQLEDVDARLLWKDLGRLVPNIARKHLTEAQALAIVDAVERLYRRQKSPTATALREVGLI